jgi:hypothetical protein
MASLKRGRDIGFEKDEVCFFFLRNFRRKKFFVGEGRKKMTRAAETPRGSLR